MNSDFIVREIDADGTVCDAPIKSVDAYSEEEWRSILPDLVDREALLERVKQECADKKQEIDVSTLVQNEKSVQCRQELRQLLSQRPAWADEIEQRFAALSRPADSSDGAFFRRSFDELEHWTQQQLEATHDNAAKKQTESCFCLGVFNDKEERLRLYRIFRSVLPLFELQSTKQRGWSLRTRRELQKLGPNKDKQPERMCVSVSLHAGVSAMRTAFERMLSSDDTPSNLAKHVDSVTAKIALFSSLVHTAEGVTLGPDTSCDVALPAALSTLLQQCSERASTASIDRTSDRRRRKNDGALGVQEAVFASFLNLRARLHSNEGNWILRLRFRPVGRANKRKQMRKRARGDLADVFLRLTLHRSGVEHGEALAAVAQVMGVSPNVVSVSGTKDKHAVTTQRVVIQNPSLCNLKSDKLEAKLERVRKSLRNGTFELGDAVAASASLALGNAKGNRFTITLRSLGVSDDALFHCDKVEERLRVMAERGFLNYLGVQRFGAEGSNSALVGTALLKSDYAHALSLHVVPLPRERQESVKALNNVRDALAPFYIEDKTESTLVTADSVRTLLRAASDRQLPRGRRNKVFAVLAQRLRRIPLDAAGVDGVQEDERLRQQVGKAALAAFNAIPYTNRTKIVQAASNMVWNQTVSHLAQQVQQQVRTARESAGDSIDVPALVESTLGGGYEDKDSWLAAPGSRFYKQLHPEARRLCESLGLTLERVEGDLQHVDNYTDSNNVETAQLQLTCGGLRLRYSTDLLRQILLYVCDIGRMLCATP
ncbi:MAG: hypothetical protein MHM6MM_002298 [Cercozoa sp. M6MM]